METGAAAEVESLAHRIKGAAANISAPGLECAAFRMEEAGRAGEVAGFKELMRMIDARFEALRGVLQGVAHASA